MKYISTAFVLINTISISTETTETVDFVARIPSTSDNLVDVCFRSTQRSLHNTLRIRMDLLLDMHLFTIQKDELGRISTRVVVLWHESSLIFILLHNKPSNVL